MGLEEDHSTESITPEQLNVQVADAGLFWQGIPADLDQEATVTFDRIGKEAGKPQSNGIWGEGVIEVLYDAPGGTIQVWGYDLEAGWVQMGKDLPVDFKDGDQFSVRLGKDGSVEIYRNGELLETVEITAQLLQPVSYDLSTPADQTEPTGTPTPTITPAPEVSPTVETTPTITAFPTGTITPTPLDASLDAPLPPESSALLLSGPVTIGYDYDPLNRLTGANYDNGDYYTYTISHKLRV
jgi:hypothetical protein